MAPVKIAIILKVLDKWEDCCHMTFGLSHELPLILKNSIIIIIIIISSSSSSSSSSYCCCCLTKPTTTI